MNNTNIPFEGFYDYASQEAEEAENEKQRNALHSFQQTMSSNFNQQNSTSILNLPHNFYADNNAPSEQFRPSMTTHNSKTVYSNTPVMPQHTHTNEQLTLNDDLILKNNFFDDNDSRHFIYSLQQAQIQQLAQAQAQAQARAHIQHQQQNGKKQQTQVPAHTSSHRHSYRHSHTNPHTSLQTLTQTPTQTQTQTSTQTQTQAQAQTSIQTQIQTQAQTQMQIQAQQKRPILTEGSGANSLFQFAQPHSSLQLDPHLDQQFVDQPLQEATPVRQEYDVFYELLSLAASSSRAPNTNAWPMPNSILTQYPTFNNTNVIDSGSLQQTNQPYREVKAPNIIDCSPSERIYNLEIIQQPLRARMCGFGDKDRRPISPPPILKLTVTTKSGQIINPDTLDVSFLVVMCDSCIEATPKEGDGSSPSKNTLSQIVSFPTIVVDENGIERQTTVEMKNLVGSSVSSATKLYDLDGKLGIFFIFQDISLRTEGSFRLRFSLIDVTSPYSQSVNTTTVSHVLKMVQTEPFMVYTAKKFPGVVQSTPLSKCLASQGIKIPIRKEKNDTSKKRTLKADEVSEDEDDT